MKSNDQLIEQIKSTAVCLGDSMSLARAEVVMNQAKEQGLNGYIVLYDGENKPVKFYTLLDEVDDIYRKIVGMSKDEWTALLKQNEPGE